MTLPGFTADVAPGASVAPYGSLSSAGFGASAAAGVVGAAFGFPFPLIRCCGPAPLFGNRVVCVQRRQRPGETCTCADSLTGPVVLCKNNVLTF
jgi:hypothetical protein